MQTRVATGRGDGGGQRGALPKVTKVTESGAFCVTVMRGGGHKLVGVAGRDHGAN